jgi:hypothetical protein
MWRSVTCTKILNHPRFKHLPLVKGLPEDVIEVVRGVASWAEHLADHPDTDKLFDQPGKAFFVVENWLGDVALIRTGARTPFGLIELRQYSAALGLRRSAGEAESLSELIGALESGARRLRALADDGWELFRYPATGGQTLVDARRPDEDLTADDLP